MDVGKIIVGEPQRPVRDHRIDQSQAWRAMAWFTLLFVCVGLVDIGLVLPTANVATPVGRFATFAGLATGLPLLTIGAIGFLMSGIGARSPAVVRSAVGLCALLALGEFVGVTLMLIASSPAFAATPPAAQGAMRQAMARALVFYGVFGGAVVVACVTGLRASRGAVET